MSDALNALAANIVSRHKSGADPYILFLGAGASISSGCASMLAIANDLLRSHDLSLLTSWDGEIAKAEKIDPMFGELQRREVKGKKVGRFLEVWENLDSETKYAFLRRHLSDGKIPSPGYIELAHLVKAKFFPTILTTNLDTLMEKALIAAGLLQPEDFIVVVNGKDSPSEVADQLESSRAAIKIVKLHGTLESPRSYAFTPEEIFSFEKTIRSSLARIVNQSLIVVGHSMQDRDINILFEDDGKEIHFVNPIEPQRGSAIENVLSVRGLGTVISGADGAFDGFFEQLRRQIETLSAQSVKTNSGPSIEEFLRGIGLEAELKAPRSRYKNLETLYVKPTEYPEILNKLESDHVVFIIGEPHMGKTYTALYLLWQYHQKGYETIHVRHDRLIHLLHRHDNDLKQTLLELFTAESQRPRIVHFDDPFGETSERRTQAIADQMDMFLQMATSYEHLRVVVTSRLNIFNEALAGHSGNELQDLEKTLRVHTSYKREVLLDILHRYVSFYQPAWANDQRITLELDEKLPSMLPAPHNIEFFVSTSETLNTLEAVLAHVEESKKMISALAGWMKHLSPHEQIFLMWVEICSTANILFPGTSASEINIEKAYKENLAYLFSEGHLPGIPTMPFQSARDKFETILIERREDGGDGSLRLDFVHPSYHEAFWYAVNRKFPIVQWWALLADNTADVLGKLFASLDLVQLKMIERYGTINRNLDQLLLMSAESKDPNEQLIALEHMLNRPEQFLNLPQFVTCVSSIVDQVDTKVLVGFLQLYSKHFDRLPQDVLRVGLPFIFSEDHSVRLLAQNIISGKLNALQTALRNEMAVKQWVAINKLIDKDTDDRLISLSLRRYSEDGETVLNRLVGLSPEEIGELAQIRSSWVTKTVFALFDEAWDRLSNEQRKAIAQNTLLPDDEDLRRRIEAFVADHATAYMHLGSEFPFLQAVAKFQSLFSLSSDENLDVAFAAVPIQRWPSLSAALIREFSSVSALNVGLMFTTRILEKYEEFSPEDGNAYIDALYQPTVVSSLIRYVEIHKQSYDDIPRSYSKLSENVLLRLLNVPHIVQYECLTSLLLRFDRLSLVVKESVNALIANPPGWWVGGSVGQLCLNYYAGSLSKRIESTPWELAGLNRTDVGGALLSEMAQAYLDQNLGLHEKYQPLMRSLLENGEIRGHAENWMEHFSRVIDSGRVEYWSDMKSKFRSLLTRTMFTSKS